MSKLFEEIDYRPTPIGPISLRRRHITQIKQDIYEIILGDEHLMSSLFTASEVALANLALKDRKGPLDVIVGGLGLGYTAHTVLQHATVKSLTVIEMLDAVIEWHRQELVPLTPPLTKDERCQLLCADFFANAASTDGFDPEISNRQYDVILIDIDHTPDWLLDARSGHFYSTEGMAQLAQHLRPDGIMGLWSDAPPDEDFTNRMSKIFINARAEPVTFRNPLNDLMFTQTVYLGEV